MPREVQSRCRARESELHGPMLPGAWTSALEMCIDKTAALFAEGRTVCDGVGGRLKFELRLTWLGGRRVLDRVRTTGADILHVRPSLGAADVPILLWRAALWGATRPDGAKDQLLLLVSGASGGRAPRHRGCLGLLPCGGRCSG